MEIISIEQKAELNKMITNIAISLYKKYDTEATQQDIQKRADNNYMHVEEMGLKNVILPITFLIAIQTKYNMLISSTLF